MSDPAANRNCKAVQAQAATCPPVRSRVGPGGKGLLAAVAIAATMAGLSELVRSSLGASTAPAVHSLRAEPTAEQAPAGSTQQRPGAAQSGAAPPASGSPRPVPADSRFDGPCPAGMVEVQGDYCLSVLHRCVRWISQSRDRCAEYEPTSRCFGEPIAKHFCIDQYEYPNQRGAVPEVGMSWEQAKAACEGAGKRLCTSSEWTLACEGVRRTPYPDGYERGACNQDRPYIFPDDAAFCNPATRPSEIERLRQSHPSGARPGCVSYYGAYDMTGNVDEWVVNEQGSPTGHPYQSGLKGGYWGPVRNRCRPMTVDHNAWHKGYQIGFRCCADLPDSP
jgi:sulfatase modifying factor 1